MKKRMRPSDEAIKNFYAVVSKAVIRILRERQETEKTSE